jgi:hypothetical protein
MRQIRDLLVDEPAGHLAPSEPRPGQIHRHGPEPRLGVVDTVERALPVRCPYERLGHHVLGLTEVAAHAEQLTHQTPVRRVEDLLQPDHRSRSRRRHSTPRRATGPSGSLKTRLADGDPPCSIGVGPVLTAPGPPLLRGGAWTARLGLVEKATPRRLLSSVTSLGFTVRRMSKVGDSSRRFA